MRTLFSIKRRALYICVKYFCGFLVQLRPQMITKVPRVYLTVVVCNLQCFHYTVGITLKFGKL